MGETIQVALGNMLLDLSAEDQGIRVKSENESVILPAQTLDKVLHLIVENFGKVRSFYMSRAEHAQVFFSQPDIDGVSVAIMLHYLYMYNMWRKLHKEHADIDLRFDEKDFDVPGTNDIIFSFFRKLYPVAWQERCCVLLAMGLPELQQYYKSRELFYDR